MDEWIDRFQKALDKTIDEAFFFSTLEIRWKRNLQLVVSLFMFIDLVMLLFSALDKSIGFLEILPIMIFGVLFAACYPLLMFVQKHRVTHFIVSMVISFFGLYLLFVGGARFFQLWILVYPLAICFFMGNGFAIPFLCLTFVNLVLLESPIFDGIRNLLFIEDAYTPALRGILPVMFFSFSVIAVMLEYIRNRTNRKMIGLAAQLADNSHTDALTGLMNRRAFYENFLTKAGTFKIQPARLQLIMCDIDHFKKFNDNYNHNVGDSVLKHIATILRSHLRGNDTCFRWGGEEFLMLLPETTNENAVSVANRMRVVVENTPMSDPTFGNLSVTMSFGVHEFSADATVDENIAMADTYMYKAKRNGRNRVEYMGKS